MRTARHRWLYAAAAIAIAVTSGTGRARPKTPSRSESCIRYPGTMAISETILKDLMLMEVAEINAKGGLLGKKIEPVVVDPASNWPLFAEKARELLAKNKVCGRVRLLDVGVPQIGAAGVRGTQRAVVLSARI